MNRNSQQTVPPSVTQTLASANEANFGGHDPYAFDGRQIVGTSSGHQHGPVTRIVSPSDIGELIKPFVFLDYFDFTPTAAPLFPMHPHSGIATVTVLLNGELKYEDTTGARGILAAGSVEWLRAGEGVWHDASPTGTQRFRGYQLWLALPAALENAEAQSQYLAPSELVYAGPARVIAGVYQGVTSSVASPDGITYLHVHLNHGATWRYATPKGHTVAWAHVNQGALITAKRRIASELAVFEESEEDIVVTAQGETDFVIGSAVKHPHELVLGYYSVHTNRQALARGEAEISRIGEALKTRKA
jgi:redox-sensitive bicupin YhaK (pirin superfamily)